MHDDALGFALAADWSVATSSMRCRRSASTPGSRPTPGASYPGPWRLPGPDSHRLAILSLSLGYIILLLSDRDAPELLDTPHRCIEMMTGRVGFRRPFRGVYELADCLVRSAL
jgi:hypothetical protein